MEDNTKTVSLTELKESGELEAGVVYFEHQDADTGKVELTKMEAAKGEDSPAIVDGALYCLLNGSFRSPYTGRTEEYKMLINGLSIDGIGGGGSSGYEKKETTVCLVPEQTFEVIYDSEAEVYRISPDPINSNYDEFNNFEPGTEGTCVYDGKEYKAVLEQRYVGFVQTFVAVYDGDDKILEITASGSASMTVYEEGSHTVAVYFVASSMNISEEFKEAVSMVSNLAFVGTTILEVSPQSYTSGTTLKARREITVDFAPSENNPFLIDGIINESGNFSEGYMPIITGSVHCRPYTIDNQNGNLIVKQYTANYGLISTTIYNDGDVDVDIDNYIASAFHVYVAIFKILREYSDE